MDTTMADGDGRAGKQLHVSEVGRIGNTDIKTCSNDIIVNNNTLVWLQRGIRCAGPAPSRQARRLLQPLDAISYDTTIASATAFGSEGH